MFKLDKVQKFFKNKMVIIPIVVVVLLVLALKTLRKEHFTGLDSSILSNIGMFVTGEEQEEANLIHEPMGHVATEGCYIPSVLEEQKKFLSQKVETLTSSDLLPSSEDEIQSNVLFSGFQHGVDSRVNKNANQQIRSDPVVPRIENVSPFNQTTIVSQDIYRKTLEIS